MSPLPEYYLISLINYRIISIKRYLWGLPRRSSYFVTSRHWLQCVVMTRGVDWICHEHLYYVFDQSIICLGVHSIWCLVPMLRGRGGDIGGFTWFVIGEILFFVMRKFKILFPVTCDGSISRDAWCFKFIFREAWWDHLIYVIVQFTPVFGTVWPSWCWCAVKLG